MSIYENISLFNIALKRPFRVLSNTLNAFLSRPKTGKPFKIKFESSAVCNLKCKMCPLTSGLQRKQGVLKFENFKKVYDEIRVPYLNLTGLGEPLMNKNIFKIIKYARKNGSLVKLDTNGTLLNKKNIKELIENNPTIVSVSIDGIKKENYESIRNGANFEEVIQNLKNLIKFRNESKSDTKIHLFFVLQKDNFFDLIGLIKFGKKIGVDVIKGTMVMDYGNAKNLSERNIDFKKIEKLREQIEQIKKDLNITLNIENIEDFLKDPENFSKNIQNKPCFYPWYNPCITWDGYVVPCDVHCNNEIVFGNAFEEPFMKIWNNEKAQEFRKQLLKKRTGVCSKCFVDETFIYEKLKPFYKIPIIRLLSKRK